MIRLARWYDARHLGSRATNRLATTASRTRNFRGRGPARSRGCARGVGKRTATGEWRDGLFRIPRLPRQRARLPPRFRDRLGDRVVPDRGRRAGGRARAVDLGHLQPHAGPGPQRRHRRHRRRPLPPAGCRPRPDGEPGSRGVPVLDRVVPHPGRPAAASPTRRASRSTAVWSTGCSSAASGRSRRCTTGTFRRRSRMPAAGSIATPPCASPSTPPSRSRRSATACTPGRRSTSRGAPPTSGTDPGRTRPAAPMAPPRSPPCTT